MGILGWLFKVTIGTFIKKIVSMAVLVGCGLYAAHHFDRLAPIAANLSNQSETMIASQPEGLRRNAAEKLVAAADWYLANHVEHERLAGLGVSTDGWQSTQSSSERSFGNSFSIASRAEASVPKETAQTDHYDTKARIASFSRQCRLVGKRYGQSITTELMDCSLAESMAGSPGFEGFAPYSYRTVEYLYYAPDGQTVLTGRYNPESLLGLEIGGVIDVRVNLDNPNRARPI